MLKNIGSLLRDLSSEQIGAIIASLMWTMLTMCATVGVAMSASWAFGISGRYTMLVGFMIQAFVYTGYNTYRFMRTA